MDEVDSFSRKKSLKECNGGGRVVGKEIQHGFLCANRFLFDNYVCVEKI